MTTTDTLRNQPTTAELRELRFEIEEFNATYAQVLDEGDLYDWPKFFTDDGFYRITGRENADEGLPIGLIYCDGMGMLIDRTRAIVKTTMHAPRYLRHFNSNVQVLGVSADGEIESRSNYLVVETLMEDKTRIFQAGRYDDVFIRTDDGDLKLKKRDCVYDSLIIPNALVYPV
ncbi:MAG: aromatic-ring-hydroxylating dioxygenase subunit beta [Rhodospirillaceae bacterium]|jgi:anthranilate 1,2-dioxygenase small subunit|nr:aromatic-ring-hydroxylating dioxygenase subunit beta [Rhodospirillaceae bacterium]